jgi:hypothetical protein
MRRSPASINSALTNFGVLRSRSLPRLRMPKEMSPALARIHAHVCGDGHLYCSREKDSYGYLKTYREGYYRQRYGFCYTNLDMRLIESFQQDVREVFNLTPRYCPSGNRVTVRSKEAWRFLRSLGAGKSREWKIPPEIMGAEAAIQAAWLRAFFNDEAHFVAGGGIRVRSVNRPGLEQAAQMLRQFIPCHLTPAEGLYPDVSCYLAVSKSARKRFLEVVGSTKCTE